MPSILVSSIISHRTKEPIIEIKLPKAGPNLPKHLRNLEQMTVPEARQFAMNILSVCESAIQDAFLMDFCREVLQLEEIQQAQMLDQFRSLRRDRQIDPTS